jgi:hypothetical protein
MPVICGAARPCSDRTADLAPLSVCPLLETNVRTTLQIDVAGIVPKPRFGCSRGGQLRQPKVAFRGG